MVQPTISGLCQDQAVGVVGGGVDSSAGDATSLGVGVPGGRQREVGHHGGVAGHGGPHCSIGVDDLNSSVVGGV